VQDNIKGLLLQTGEDTRLFENVEMLYIFSVMALVRQNYIQELFETGLNSGKKAS
jgi:hypothetical protein